VAAKLSDARKLPTAKPKPEATARNAAALPTAARPIRPGVERWPVKTGTDDDVGDVDVSQRVQTAVEALVNTPRPSNMLPVDRDFPAYQRRRVHGVETMVSQVDVWIIAHKEEDDGDYHLVLQGDTGKTMIAECPDPDPAFIGANNGWADTIKLARTELTSQLNPQRTLTKDHVRARITGVVFFDRVHGQDGVALTNGIEIHPILGIEWLDDSGKVVASPPATTTFHRPSAGKRP
jgi:hypothetical protein